MKLRPQTSTQPPIFEHYEHPWYEFNKNQNVEARLIKPNQPTKEAIEKAKFKDKTYQWKGK